MGDQRINERLVEQRGVVAVWQLIDDGCSEGAIRHAATGMRTVHGGVFLSGHAPPTPWQFWKAAELTTPSSALADWSAGTLTGIRERRDRLPTTIVRPGTGHIEVIPMRPGRVGSLKVRRSTTLEGDVVEIDGIRTTTAARTLLDLVARVGPDAGARMVRDALRLRAVTVGDLWTLVARHRGDRGVRRLRTLLEEYAPLGLDRTASDPEAVGLALLERAGVRRPLVNAVIAGGEADFAWVDERAIVELDGPQYHLFPSHDLRKQRGWEAAGWSVERLSTNLFMREPHLLLPLVPAGAWLPTSPLRFAA